MRSRILPLALLALPLLAANVQAQQYTGWRPDAGALPVAYQDAPSPDNEISPSDAPMASSAADAVSGGCDTCGCDDCCDCGPRGWFVNAEYLMWWTKGRSLPPLVTTSPAGTAQAATGVLPGATILFGNDNVGQNLGNGGGRLTFGKWLGQDQNFAISGRFTAFRGDDGFFTATSNGTNNLAIPFFDALAGAENAYLVAFSPNGVTPFAAGNVTVRDRLDLLAAEVYAQTMIINESGTRWDLFGGYHMLRLDNSLSMDSSMTSLNAAILAPVGTNVLINDTFEGRNEFHGGALGVMGTVDYGTWYFNFSGKMSVGNMHQTVIVNGQTVVTTPGPTQDIRNEGLFAIGDARGTRSQDRIAYIPEANLKLGYRVRQNVALTLGYNFMYINSVVLGGDQIDRNLNLSQTNGLPLIGPNRPVFQNFRDTDFWAQGINFGVEVAF
jgi:hypothetical protein